MVFDSDLYPLPKEFQPEQVYQINAGTVFGLFTQVRHAVSSDTNRPWSCCVQFTDHRMYALDGYTIGPLRFFLRRLHTAVSESTRGALLFIRQVRGELYS